MIEIHDPVNYDVVTILFGKGQKDALYNYDKTDGPFLIRDESILKSLEDSVAFSSWTKSEWLSGDGYIIFDLDFDTVKPEALESLRKKNLNTKILTVKTL